MNDKWYPAAGEVGVVGRFEYYDHLDVPASKAADEVVTKPIIVCRMKVAGSVDESFVKVKPHNQSELVHRFPDAWLAFQGQEVKIDGTPLSKLGLPEQFITVLGLTAVNTVEQLAGLSDAACQNMGFGYRKHRDTAKEYLVHGEDALPHNKITNHGDPPKNKGGRPKGSKNKPKDSVEQVAA